MPASTAGAAPGDFVALRLADHKGTFQEIVWGVIEGIHGAGKVSKLPGGKDSTAMLVRLTGSIGTSSVHAPSTGSHGFALGNKLLLNRNCAWEVFRASPNGMALCGLFGRQVAGHGPVATAAEISPGEEALVFLAAVKPSSTLIPAAGWDVPNPAWGTVVRISPLGNVVTLRLLEDPSPVAGLALRAGAEVDVTRDCIFGVRPAGG